MLGSKGNLKRFGGPFIGPRGASAGKAEREVPLKAPLQPQGDRELGTGVRSRAVNVAEHRRGRAAWLARSWH